MMFLLSRQKDVSVLLEADNKAELIQQLRLYPKQNALLIPLDFFVDFHFDDEFLQFLSFFGLTLELFLVPS